MCYSKIYKLCQEYNFICVEKTKIYSNPSNQQDGFQNMVKNTQYVVVLEGGANISINDVVTKKRGAGKEH